MKNADKKQVPWKQLLLIKNCLGSFVTKNSRLTIILINTIVTILTASIFYNLLPVLLNYTPDFVEESKLLGASYLSQYMIVFSFAIIAGDIFLFWILRGIDKWRNILHSNSIEDQKKIHSIWRRCISLPYLVYIIQILFPTGSVGILFSVITLINGTSLVIVGKVTIIVFTLFSLTAVFTFIFSKRIYTKILLQTYRREELGGNRINLTSKIIIQVLPMLTVAILFTSFLGYSRIIADRGDFIFKFYKSDMTDRFSHIKQVKDTAQLKEILNKVGMKDTEITHFIITPDQKTITLDGTTIDNLFLFNLKHFSDARNGRVYGEAGEVEGTIIKLHGNTGIWTVGVKYPIPSSNVFNYFLVGFIALLMLNILVLYFFSRTLSGEISLIAEGLTAIVEEDVDLDRRLAVTSNDEIGDLVIAFNKVQEKEKEHIKEVEEQQAILMEQERLASLGNLIGGIAHNLRTPIMSLSGGIEGLKDLIKEYDESIDDEKVTKEDHHQIAKEMNVWIEKMRPYCSYMSDIITAVKGQTIQISEKSALNFTIDELCKRIEILLEHELRNRHCKMKMDIKADRNIQINGEISALVQVLNNLIINSVDSYDGKGGDVDFIITSSDKTVEFIIKDYGSGIPEDVKEKLFKEMITTKGSKGTGLGLYMSYSNIKARFGGKMRFESEKGKGTAFYIYIPYK